MKKNRNSGLLLILMIISQIMLTGFVIQWLRLQWQNENELLKKDLNQIFKESVNIVLDSMLVKNVITPAIIDSSGIPGNIKKQEGVISAGRIQKSHSYNTSLSKLRPDETLSGRYDNSETGILLRSVKLFIGQAKDSIGEGSHLRHIISVNPDTNLLKVIFENNLRRAGYRSEIWWLSDFNRTSRNNRIQSIYFESYLLEKPYGAVINGFPWIIFISIIGQFLFGLILISFTGTAFLVTSRSMKKMEALDKLRNDFVNNITHELKTPVSTVTVALEALRNYLGIKDHEKSDEYLEIASKEIKRLDQLITQVLDTSALNKKDQFLKTKDSDLVIITKEVLESMKVRFLNQNARVNFKTDKEVSILKLDSLHIQGVLFNLLDNSLKYGTNSPEITLRIEHKKNEILLTIRDNGPGIPKEYITKVFDKFFRVPAGDRHNVKGYGLGLNYAEQIMINHSGSIKVKNLKEGGCFFTLTFPRIKN